MSETHCTPKSQTLLTTSQAAEKLGLSPRTLEAYRLKGGGPRYLAVGTGRFRPAIRYAPADLRRWIATRGTWSTSDSGLSETELHVLNSIPADGITTPGLEKASRLNRRQLAEVLDELRQRALVEVRPDEANLTLVVHLVDPFRA